MADPPRIASAVVLSTDAGARERLAGLLKSLAGLGVRVELASEASAALKAVQAAEEIGSPLALFIDSRRELAQTVHELRAEHPSVAPVILFRDPSAEAVVEALRAGVADVLDLASAGEQAIERVLRRLSDRHQKRSERRRHLAEIRRALEEFLRDLVKTERRSIDLENKLSAEKSHARKKHVTDDPIDRKPVLLLAVAERATADLLVDRLEEMGLVTYGFIHGEEAAAHSRQLAAEAEPIDLALVDTGLPDMDGRAAVRALHDHYPELPVLFLAPESEARAAASAEEEGVLGSLIKPFDDVAATLERIREQALASLREGRERAYLERIKLRHQKVLLRYRELATALEDLEDLD